MVCALKSLKTDIIAEDTREWPIDNPKRIF